MRNLLIRLAILYNGDYFKIRKAVTKQEKADISIPLQKAITIMDKDYPKELLKLQRPPFVLFYEGNKDLLKKRKIAVVGSRNLTDYGKKATMEVVETLKDRFVIVSGLAKGVDSLAHYCSNQTIGVIGNGIDIVYPKENEQLYEKMKEYQLIISEYPKGVRPEKRNFPFRNRIIAALAEAVVVTQAQLKSGTMITVNEALNLNKEIYVVPYPYDDVMGEGCNQLIQQGANLFLRHNLNDIFDKKENI